MIRRLFRKARSGLRAAPNGINLVGDLPSGQQSTPAPIGIDPGVPAAAWTVGRLEQIFRRCNASPTDPQAQLEARHARHRLSRFWLEAPIDQLEILYGGSVGRAYRELLLGSLPALPLAPDEASWKESLARRLQEDFEAPERPNLLLAVMPYCAPGRMRLENPLTSLPPWLLAEYSHCFDPELARPAPAAGQHLPRSAVPPVLIGGSAAAAPAGFIPPMQPGSAPPPSGAPAVAPPTVAPPTVAPSGVDAPRVSQATVHEATVAADPAAAPPQLSEQRGAEAFALFQQSEFNERMIGLINLFRIDPDDDEVVRELRRLRRLMGQVWLDATPSSLEPLYQSPMGLVFRELLASDLGALPPDGEELVLRQALTAVAVDQDHPAMAQALLAVMPFHPQGKMRLGSGQDRLPGWLREAFPTLSGMPKGA